MDAETNAAKFGALSEINGHVEIRWTRLSDDRLHITWTETGGPVTTRPARRGFGTHVMETLIKLDLGGNHVSIGAPRGSFAGLRFKSDFQHFAGARIH